MTRIAIVGAGTMGQLHAQSCLNLPDAQVTWVADRHAERAEALAALLGAGCRATTDNAEAVGAADVDAVLVCVPTSAHREVTELAAARGKHVFCEKPIARTLADAEAMVEACRSAGVRLMVGHVVRFFPEYARIRELLREDAVGQVGVVRAARLNAYPRPDRDWYTDLDACGGPIVDLMIHDLDTLRWYFGEPRRVYARGLSGREGPGERDYALAVVRFANGVIAHCEGSWAHPDGFRTAIEVAGDGGLLTHSSVASDPLRWERPPAEGGAASFVPRSPVAESPYRVELRHFVERLADGAPFQVDGEEGVRSLALALATLDSVRTGRVVTFPIED